MALYVRRGEVSHEAKGHIVVFDPSETVEFFVFLDHSFAVFAYLSDAHADLDEKTAGYLKAQGFVMNDPRSLVTPDRTSLEVSPRSPLALYIGRGGDIDRVGTFSMGQPLQDQPGC